MEDLVLGNIFIRGGPFLGRLIGIIRNLRLVQVTLAVVVVVVSTGLAGRGPRMPRLFPSVL